MRTRRPVSIILLVTFCSYSLASNGLQSSALNDLHVVRKEQLKEDLAKRDQERQVRLAKVNSFFEKGQVKKTLRSLGINQRELEAKVAVLTPKELESLQTRMDQITQQYPGGIDPLLQVVLVLIVLILVISVVLWAQSEIEN